MSKSYRFFWDTLYSYKKLWYICEYQQLVNTWEWWENNYANKFNRCVGGGDCCSSVWPMAIQLGSRSAEHKFWPSVTFSDRAISWTLVYNVATFCEKTLVVLYHKWNYDHLWRFMRFSEVASDVLTFCDHIRNHLPFNDMKDFSCQILYLVSLCYTLWYFY